MAVKVTWYSDGLSRNRTFEKATKFWVDPDGGGYAIGSSAEMTALVPIFAVQSLEVVEDVVHKCECGRYEIA